MIKIATYRGSFKEKFGVPRQAGVVPQLLGSIVLEKEYSTPDAVRGLEDFDFLWLLWGFSENRHTAQGVTVRPPRLGGNKSLGVFATRSPYRPNPIGLSSVRLDHIDYNCDGACPEQGRRTPVIYVRGADLVDGTPIYDIKPYIPYTDAHPNARAGFTDRVHWQPLKVFIECDTPKDICQDELREILSQDPRPHYHDDPQRVYGMDYAGCNVRFRVENDKVYVIEVKKQQNPCIIE